MTETKGTRVSRDVGPLYLFLVARGDNQATLLLEKYHAKFGDYYTMAIVLTSIEDMRNYLNAALFAECVFAFNSDGFHSFIEYLDLRAMVMSILAQNRTATIADLPTGLI